MTMLADRVLPLSGVHNFRDYGGYGVEGGGRLRDGSLWRSAQHAEADDDDLAAIDALGIETIIDLRGDDERSEEHTSELPSLMRISYAVFCLKKKNIRTHNTNN